MNTSTIGGEQKPYAEAAVPFTNGDVSLAGTLTLPSTRRKHPAVVLLQGSGSMNRDEEVGQMKPFKIIADCLARRGIAVLRYDSRGVGGTTGEAFQYTLSDVADDVVAAVRYLKARSDIERDKIGLCGHSQGGIVAPMCAAQSSDVAFIVCIAGIGNTGEENFLTQTAQAAEMDGASEAEIRDRVHTMERVVKLIREGTGLAELKSAITSNGDTGEDATIDCQLDLFSSPWFRSFIDHDAQTVLENVKCPALLIFGGLDRQVRPDTNREAMVAALERGGNSNYVVKTFPTANHLFQNAKTGSASEYTTLEPEFVPGFLELLSDWMVARVTSD